MGEGSRIRTFWKPLHMIASRRNDAKRLFGIYSQAEFAQLMEYERTRSDRLGTRVSLVNLDLCSFFPDKRRVRDCVYRLKRLVRTTDHVGWYENQVAGVLLPSTCRESAWKFVDKLRSEERLTSVPVSVYTHPDTWLAQERNPGAQVGSRGDPEDAGRSGLPFTRAMPRWKRAIDISVSVACLLLLSPVFLLIALYIRIVSPGPVIFAQRRVGLGRRLFTFLKFRTMHYKADETTHNVHVVDFIHSGKPMAKLDERDPRIIPGGRILRALCLDELPQLWNVLRGDMSLVGPRPCMPYEAREYLRWHNHRFSILPGLTGLWQVSGKNKLTLQQMIRLDVAYEKKMSFLLDISIIVRTVPAILKMLVEALCKKAMRFRNGILSKVSGKCSAHTIRS